MLVSEAIERAYDEWLSPAGVDRAAFDTLQTGIDNSTLTLTLTGRQNSVPPDTILEIDSELMMTNSVSGTGPFTVTLATRGYQETDAATHATGALVYFDPEYPRKQVFNALSTAISRLYPLGLYAIATDDTQLFSSLAVKTLPAGAKDILSVLVRPIGSNETWTRLAKGDDFQVYKDWSPPKYQLYSGGDTNATMHISYMTDFTLPVAETDDLTTTCKVPSTLAPYLPMAAAAYLLQGKELPALQIEEIRRLLATQGAQTPGARFNVARALMQVFEGYVALERGRLLDQFPIRYEYQRVS